MHAGTQYVCLTVMCVFVCVPRLLISLILFSIYHSIILVYQDELHGLL